VGKTPVLKVLTSRVKPHHYLSNQGHLGSDLAVFHFECNVSDCSQLVFKIPTAFENIHLGYFVLVFKNYLNKLHVINICMYVSLFFENI